MRRAAAVLVLLVGILPLCSRAQSPSIIEGRVVAADTGDPLRNASVTVTAMREAAPILTDNDGRFSYPSPTGGSYTLTVAKAGYAKTTVTVRSPAPPVVTMPRGAVIAGTVVDDRGDPVVGGSVIVETAVTEGRRPTVLATPITDDLGEYRAADLPSAAVVVAIFARPGSFRMTIGPGGTTMFGGAGGDLEQRVYFPGVSSAATAAVFSLQPGDEHTGVSFTVTAAAAGPGIQTPAYSPLAPNDTTAAVIEGRVLRPGGHALTGAIVRLIPSASTLAPPKLAVTDVEGRYQFVLPNEAAGTYRVAVAAFNQAYLPTEYGQRRPSDQGEEITVAAGERRERLDVTMARPGVIAGRVVDENGDPVEGLILRASQVRYVDGRRRLVDMARFAQPPTDDLGRYRLAGLEPGEYIVGAAVGQIDMRTPLVDLPGYGTTYFPGTPNPAEAQRVVVGRSQDLLGIDFPIVRTRTVRVSGYAVDSRGETITGGIALTPSRRSGAVVAAQMGAKIGRDGRFEFPNVAPGEYVLQASRHRSAGWTEGESSTQFVTVNDVDVTDLQIRTAAGSTLDGHITLDGRGTFGPGQLNVSTVPVDSDLSPLIGGGPARATVEKDLRFHLAGLTGPRRVRVSRVPSGWVLQAILLNGIDVTDTPLPFGKPDQSVVDLEVVFSQRVTAINGQITARGRPAAASVLFFAADRQAWYPQSRFFARIVSGSDGRFRAEGLPPGEYLAIALDAVPGGRDGDQWQDPDYLETLVARAKRMTLAEGGSVTLSLEVSAR